MKEQEKLLITGGSGLLGATLAQTACFDYQVIATHRSNPVSIPNCQMEFLDITNAEAVEALISSVRPRVIIHTAALTGVDYCEQHPKAAYAVNVLGTANIARSATRANAHVIYVSTDYVFDGTAGGYDEEAAPNPVNVYGSSKLAGERAVMDLCTSWTIVRTTFYGPNPFGKKGYFERIIGGLRDKTIRSAPVNAFFSPLPVHILSQAILELARQRRTGIYHVAGREKCSRYDFIVKTAHAFGLDATTTIKPVALTNSESQARRPQDTSLNISKALRELNIHLPDVEEGLASVRRMLEEVGSGWR